MCQPQSGLLGGAEKHEEDKPGRGAPTPTWDWMEKGHTLSHRAETACPSLQGTLCPSPKAPALDTLSLKRKNQILQVPAQNREIRPPNSNATGS